MTAGDESWRVFCAIELPGEVVKRATEHIRLLREEYPHTPASWIRDGNFHLTLKFIGEIPRVNVDSVSRAVQRATQQFRPQASLRDQETSEQRSQILSPITL